MDTQHMVPRQSYSVYDEGATSEQVSTPDDDSFKRDPSVARCLHNDRQQTKRQQRALIVVAGRVEVSAGRGIDPAQWRIIIFISSVRVLRLSYFYLRVLRCT